MGFGTREVENTTILQRAVIEGNAYRISSRRTLADGEEFIVHIDPSVSGETVYLEAPAIQSEQRALFDVFENADPQNNLVDDLEVHNMRYDGQDEPDTLVRRVTDQGLDTSNADKTEETYVSTNADDVSTGSASQRSIYRIIPETDIISLVITDDSGGSGNLFGVDLTLYEGETLPE